MTLPYSVGLDLGQAQDYTALTVLQRMETPTGDARPVRAFAGYFGGLPQHETVGEKQEVEIEYHLRHLERFPLGTPYPDIAARVAELLRKPPLHGRANLVVDATGVGRPVVDMLRGHELLPVAVIITGGDRVHYDRQQRLWSVPKRELVSTLQVFLQSKSLAFAEGLPELEVLIEELRHFKAKISLSTGHDTYEAWRERDHDDLVLSLALALWHAEWLRKAYGLGGPDWNDGFLDELNGWD